jgi:prefoldin subunit 5
MPDSNEQHDELVQRLDDLSANIQRLVVVIGTLVKSNAQLYTSIAQLTSVMSSKG